MNPEAAKYVLGNRTSAWWAGQAGVTPGHLSSVISGRKGATDELALRLAEAVGVHASVLFPQLAKFTCEVRVFTVSATEMAA